MLKHSLFISLSVGKFVKRNCQTEYWDYHKAHKQTKLKKEQDIIIVIQSGVCYNFNIIDSGKPI